MGPGLHKVRYPGNGVTSQTLIWQPNPEWAFGSASQILQTVSLMTVTLPNNSQLAQQHPVSLSSASQPKNSQPT